MIVSGEIQLTEAVVWGEWAVTATGSTDATPCTQTSNDDPVLPLRRPQTIEHRRQR